MSPTVSSFACFCLFTCLFDCLFVGRDSPVLMSSPSSVLLHYRHTHTCIRWIVRVVNCRLYIVLVFASCECTSDTWALTSHVESFLLFPFFLSIAQRGARLGTIASLVAIAPHDIDWVLGID